MYSRFCPSGCSSGQVPKAVNYGDTVLVGTCQFPPNGRWLSSKRVEGLNVEIASVETEDLGNGVTCLTVLNADGEQPPYNSPLLYGDLITLRRQNSSDFLVFDYPAPSFGMLFYEKLGKVPPDHYQWRIVSMSEKKKDGMEVLYADPIRLQSVGDYTNLNWAACASDDTSLCPWACMRNFSCGNYLAFFLQNEFLGNIPYLGIPNQYWLAFYAAAPLGANCQPYVPCQEPDPCQDSTCPVPPCVRPGVCANGVPTCSVVSDPRGGSRAVWSCGQGGGGGYATASSAVMFVGLFLVGSAAVLIVLGFARHKKSQQTEEEKLLSSIT